MSQKASRRPPRVRSRESKPASAESPKRWYQTRLFNFVIGVVGIWLLLLSRSPFAFVETMSVVILADRSLLNAGRGWNPPLASVFESLRLSFIPFWSGSLLLAWIFYAALCLKSGLSLSSKPPVNPDVLPSKDQAVLQPRWLADGRLMGSLLSIAGLVGLTQISINSPVAVVICIGLAGLLAVHARDVATDRQAWKLLVLSMMLYAVSVMGTLEFGLIALALAFTCVGPIAWQLTRRTNGLVRVLLTITWGAGWLAIVSAPGLWSAGYFAALLRPVNWMWLRLPESLLPSMTAIWRTEELGWPHVLGMLIVVQCWGWAWLGRLRVGDVMLLCVLTVIGLGCGRYTWLALSSTWIVIGPRSDSDSNAASAPWGANWKFPPARNGATMALAALGLGGVLLQLATHGSTVLAADVIQRRLDYAQWNVSGVVVLGNLEETPSWSGSAVRAGQVKRQYQPVVSDRWDIFHADYQEYASVLREWKSWKREAYLRADGTWGGYQAVFSEWNPVLVALDSEDLAGVHQVSLDSQWKPIGIDFRQTVFARAEIGATQAYLDHATRALLTLEFPRPAVDIELSRVIALGNNSDARRVSGVLTALRLPFAALRVLPNDAWPETVNCAVFAYAELAHRAQRYSGQASLLDYARATSRELTGRETYLVRAAKQYLQNMEAVHRERSDTLHGGELQSLLNATAELSAPQILSRLESMDREDLSSSEAAECEFYIGCLANEVGDIELARRALAKSLELDRNGPFATLATYYLSQVN
ncbi:MAG: hypothetical protein R3C53_08040 [Pirellulaceae bacterium]